MTCLMVTWKGELIGSTFSSMETLIKVSRVCIFATYQRSACHMTCPPGGYIALDLIKKPYCPLETSTF